jgi:hypothetical protein
MAVIATVVMMDGHLFVFAEAPHLFSEVSCMFPIFAEKAISLLWRIWLFLLLNRVNER